MMRGDQERPKAASPWSNVYGVARTLIALATLSSLLVDGPDRLFRPLGQELSQQLLLPWSIRISLFSLLPGDRLWLAHLIAIVILLVVASGWRPRYTGVFHWWVAHSFISSCMIIEGGDQAAALIALLLVPVTLTDPRRWHWSPAPSIGATLPQSLATLLATSAFMVIRLQVAIIYFFASTSKLAVPEWSNGTALYYWLLYPVFGVPEYLEPLVLPVLVHPVLVTLLTWGSLALEAVLFTGLFMKSRYRRILLPLGIAFHGGIVLFQGLFSFSVIMTAALVLYLRPVDQPFSMEFVRSMRHRFGAFRRLGWRRFPKTYAAR